MRLVRPSIRAFALQSGQLLLPSDYSDSGNLPSSVLEQIVDTYADNAYRLGEATALSVGISLNGNILRSNNQSEAAEYEDPIGSVADAISRAIQSELILAQ